MRETLKATHREPCLTSLGMKAVTDNVGIAFEPGIPMSCSCRLVLVAPVLLASVPGAGRS